MRMMESVCEAVGQRLYEYLDGELTRWTRMLIRMHLRICDRCSHRCRYYQALSDGIRRQARTLDAPQSLRARLLSVIHTPEGSESSQDGP